MANEAVRRRGAAPLVRPDLHLRVDTGPGGLVVSQAGRAYLARGWQLTPEVRVVVELALAAGLTQMIQDGHPRESNLLPNGSGADYLTFSDATGRGWVFVLDMDSCPRRATPTQVKFNKRFKRVLRAEGIPCPPEWRSPQELIVRLEDLPRALEVTRPWWARLGSRKDVAAERGKHAVFVDEEDLHSHIVQGWTAFPLAARLELIRSRFLLGTTARREGEVDLLARDRANNIWILELKNRAVLERRG